MWNPEPFTNNHLTQAKQADQGSNPSPLPPCRLTLNQENHCPAAPPPCPLSPHRAREARFCLERGEEGELPVATVCPSCYSKEVLTLLEWVPACRRARASEQALFQVWGKRQPNARRVYLCRSSTSPRAKGSFCLYANPVRQAMLWASRSSWDLSAGLSSSTQLRSRWLGSENNLKQARY